MRTLGPPQDVAAWMALVAAFVTLVCALWLHRPLSRAFLKHRRLALTLLAITAAVASFAYVQHYLRGGPRIIDATSYFLEARALAKGWLAFPIPDPTAAFRGRFLLSAPAESALAVLFPPGYPVLLALGFVLGAPLAVGPLLAALLVVVTHGLARELFRRDDIALLAAGLSLLCAALRYHTADTMSHGLAAVLFAGALWAALVGGKATLIAGIAVGWLIATRPVTGLTSLVFVALVVARSERRSLPLVLLGLLPGLTLLMAHQKAATGSFFDSAQLRYYALADGPPGCFRYGFGSGIGCMFEHGDFVRAHLSDGYGWVAALGTTGRRLWLHAMDIGNAWPIALLVPWALWVGRREAPIRLLGFSSVALVVAYAPFYFDGNYPGGGARLLAEALPLEHVLVAWAVTRLGVARFVPAFALGAFALHSSRDHIALSMREGGAPMFEPAVLERAGVERGLLFVSTDHGFNLAHRPGELDPRRGLVVARHRGGALDFLLWKRLGQPPSYLHRFDAGPGRHASTIESFVPPSSTWVDGGALWPPVGVSTGWAHPDYPPQACAAGAFGLKLRGAPDSRVTLELATAAPGRYRLVSRWVAGRSGPAAAVWSVGDTRWEAAWEAEKGDCREIPGPALELAEGSFEVDLSTRGDGLVLARIDLQRVGDPGSLEKR